MSLETLITQFQPAILALADGTVFRGHAIGALGEAVGEVVFNTAMTGYQEMLTDPSYAEQIITLTYPHIGNVGVNNHDTESDRIQAKGLVIRELSPVISNWRSEQSLESYLSDNNVVAIAGIDTRCLTRILREKGAQHGCIMAGEIDESAAIVKARSFEGLTNKNLACEVSTKVVYEWTDGTLDLDPSPRPPVKDRPFHVVAYDFGVKREILRLMADRGCRISVVPHDSSVESVLALNPDGIFLSNGPGDPAACSEAIENIKILLTGEIPLFGICLGFQLMSLASGAKTTKMKFGHHGANHPVQRLSDGRVAITSQNHGFAVDEASLPAELVATHQSLFDGTLQGIAHQSKPFFAFQGHPEASPGPHDIQYLFDHFIHLMQEHQNGNTVPGAQHA